MNNGHHPTSEQSARTSLFAPGFSVVATRRKGLAQSIKAVLRLLSAVALVFAIVTALTLIFFDLAHLSGLAASWHIKSAFPLIGIGLSYLLLQFTTQRSLFQRCLSIAVSIAFIFWGSEQFISAPHITALMDDVVVFLFVADLALVIHSLGKSNGQFP